jgi:hypothetical protein
MDQKMDVRILNLLEYELDHKLTFSKRLLVFVPNFVLSLTIPNYHVRYFVRKQLIADFRRTWHPDAFVLFTQLKCFVAQQIFKCPEWKRQAEPKFDYKQAYVSVLAATSPFGNMTRWEDLPTATQLWLCEEALKPKKDMEELLQVYFERNSVNSSSLADRVCLISKQKH